MNELAEFAVRVALVTLGPLLAAYVITSAIVAGADALHLVYDPKRERDEVSTLPAPSRHAYVPPAVYAKPYAPEPEPIRRRIEQHRKESAA